MSSGLLSVMLDTVCGSCCLRRTTNKLRHEVNRLTAENEKLKTENDRLEASAKKLAETEAKLQDLSVLQGKSVDELAKQVKEFREIQEQVKVSNEELQIWTYQLFAGSRPELTLFQ